MRWLWAAVAFGLLLAAVCLLFNSRFYKMHEARCVFAVSSNAIITNETGEVVQRFVQRHEDIPAAQAEAYNDHYRVENELGWLLDRTSPDLGFGNPKNVVKGFAQAYGSDRFDARDVSNAWESVRFEARGFPAVIVDVSIHANDGDLALAALQFLVDAYADVLENEARMRKARHADDVEYEMRRLQSKGMETEGYEEQAQAWSDYLDAMSPRLYVVKPPYLAR